MQMRPCFQTLCVQPTYFEKDLRYHDTELVTRSILPSL